MRNRNRTIALVVIVLAIGWGMMYAASLSSQGGRASPLYSTYRYDASGTAALRELFEARGIKVSLLERGRMRSTDHGVLFQVLPLPPNPTAPPAKNMMFAFGPQAQVDSLSLLDWVSQGNTVVQYSRVPTNLMVELERTPAIFNPNAVWSHGAITATQPGPAPMGAGVTHSPNPSTVGSSSLAQEAESAEVGGKIDGGNKVHAQWLGTSVAPRQTLEVVAPGMENVIFTSSWKVLCKDGNKPIAWEGRFGRGRVIVISSPTPVLNNSLAWSDNASIALSLAGAGPVLLDEWSHGQPHDDSVMGMIYQVGLWPVLVQVIIALMLYVWSTAGYRRIDPPTNNRRPSSQDQVRTLGYLYGRSLSPGVAATRIYTEVLARVAAAERCAPSQVQARLAAARPEAAQRLQRILADVASAAQTEGPACLKCGYSLAGSVGPDCPDCGTPIPMKTREQIARTPVDVLTRQASDTQHKARGIVGLYYKIVGSKPNPSHLVDDILARALTDSHQLALEITRGRRNSR